MNEKREKRIKHPNFLVLAKPDPGREIEFELKYLSSLSLKERFSLMAAKSRELKTNLVKNGHRETPAIIKRK